MKNSVKNGVLTIFLSGHIDSSNAPGIEESIMQTIGKNEHTALVIDIKDLEYISSSGLRIMLRLRKQQANLRIINAQPSVYEIFEMTGFTEMIDIEKALREVSIAGCEMIGEGANGKVYRIDSDTIVKVYKDAASPDEIRRERELSRKAFVLGIPTAIAYDVVRVGDSYGAVFELLNAKSLDSLIVESEDNIEYVAQKSIEIAKIIHSTLAPRDLPDEFETVLGWLNDVRDCFSAEEYEKLRSLIGALPKEGMLIHGDYHIKNLMQQGDEVLLIDMDTLSMGHPIFELAFMYNAYKGFGVVQPEIIERFLGFGIDTAYRLWRRMLALYLGTEDEQALNDTEDKAALIGLLRLLRRRIRRGKGTEDDKAYIACVNRMMKDILNRIDTLEFRIYEA